MKIIHTADLHIGQIIYQHYDRVDEHLHFFSALENAVKEECPDVLIVAGDIFDIPQPSASSWRMFTKAFVRIRHASPSTAIVIIAGNHDSASRLQSHSDIWAMADTHIIGTPPPLSFHEKEGWEENYILRLPKGYVIMLPYMSSDRTDVAVALQDYVAKLNKEQLPVVMTGHLAVTGCDFTGHNEEIGMLRTVDLNRFGNGYDYLALGHIHRPQTLNQPMFTDTSELPSPVARYSGSALHVSCDEAYPHTLSVIEIDRHKGIVSIKEIRIEQLRHFHTLPRLEKEKRGEDAERAFTSEKEALGALEKFIRNEESCYVRLKVEKGTDLSSDFNNRVYRMIEESGKDIRYNPKILWTGEEREEIPEEDASEEIAVEQLQQMDDPLEFIRLTYDRYPALDMRMLEEAFSEIEKELIEMNEEENGKSRSK